MINPDLIDLSFQKIKRKTVRQVVTDSHAGIFKNIPESVKEHARNLQAAGWIFHITEQRRGWCSVLQKTITIPTWALSAEMQVKKPGYMIWYLAHEMAHAYDMCKHMHGPEFMAWLIKLCPEEYLKYELGYKPRNAANAGITMNGLAKPVDSDVGELGF